MSDEWYYSNDGQQSGPVSAEEMKKLAASGELSRATLVWREGMSEWAPAERIKGLLPAAARKRPLPPPLPKAPATDAGDSVDTQLARLQEKLLDGQIDKDTYDMLKRDLLGAGQKPDAATAASEPQRSRQPESGQQKSPWVKGKVRLDGKAGINLRQTWIEVYLDDELIGKGSQFEGIDLEFETATGHHSLKLLETNKVMKSTVGGLIPGANAPFAFPVEFPEPGIYEIRLLKGSVWKQMMQQPYQVAVTRTG